MCNLLSRACASAANMQFFHSKQQTCHEAVSHSQYTTSQALLVQRAVERLQHVRMQQLLISSSAVHAQCRNSTLHSSITSDHFPDNTRSTLIRAA